MPTQPCTYFTLLIYIPEGRGDSAKYYPKAQPEENIIRGLYRENTWIKKKKSLILKNKQCKFPPFWKTRAWLPRVVTTNDIPPHIPRSKPYTMVILPAAFIYHAHTRKIRL